MYHCQLHLAPSDAVMAAYFAEGHDVERPTSASTARDHFVAKVAIDGEPPESYLRSRHAALSSFARLGLTGGASLALVCFAGCRCFSAMMPEMARMGLAAILTASLILLIMVPLAKRLLTSSAACVTLTRLAAVLWAWVLGAWVSRRRAAKYDPARVGIGSSWTNSEVADIMVASLMASRLSLMVALEAAKRYLISAPTPA